MRVLKSNEAPAGPPGEGQTWSIKAQSAFGPRFDLVFSGTAKSHNRGWKRGERAEKVMLKLSGHGGSLLTRQILLKFGGV